MNALPLEVLLQLRAQTAAMCSDGVERVQIAGLTTPNREEMAVTASCDSILEALDVQIAAGVTVNSPTGVNE